MATRESILASSRVFRFSFLRVPTLYVHRTRDDAWLRNAWSLRRSMNQPLVFHGIFFLHINPSQKHVHTPHWDFAIFTLILINDGTLLTAV